MSLLSKNYNSESLFNFKMSMASLFWCLYCVIVSINSLNVNEFGRVPTHPCQIISQWMNTHKDIPHFRLFSHVLVIYC